MCQSSEGDTRVYVISVCRRYGLGWIGRQAEAVYDRTFERCAILLNRRELRFDKVQLMQGVMQTVPKANLAHRGVAGGGGSRLVVDVASNVSNPRHRSRYVSRLIFPSWDWALDNAEFER